MTPAAALVTGFVTALVIALASAAYIWMSRQGRFRTQEGLRILSGMRWRELSNLVVDALANAGFVRETAEQQSARGTADVVVYRDGRPWVLTCRQGLAQVINRASVDEFLRSLRTAHAAGGVLVTPGRVEPSARDVAPNVDVLGGEELWQLVGPLLPPSVHADVAARARARSLRASSAALAIATLCGIAVGYGLSRFGGGESPASSEKLPVAAVPRRVTAAPVPAVTPAAPMSEDEEREAIVREIAQVPGVDRALWSTRSTLQLYIADPAAATDEALCAVMKRHELLRASRLQIENPGDRPVRFMQCAVY